MGELTQKEKDLLSQYVDGTLPPRQQEQVEQDLRTNPSMREYLSLLQFIGTTLTDNIPDGPSRNFTERVLLNLNDAPARSPMLSIKGGIMILAGVLTAVGVALVLLAQGVFDTDISSGSWTMDVTDKIRFSMPAVKLSGRLVVNIIIMLNIALGWVVLDRAILKPLFQRRMQL